MMKALNCIVVFGFCLLISDTSASAAEYWKCEYKILTDSGMGLTGIGRFHIDGEYFIWETAASAQQLKPSVGIVWRKSRDRLVENNRTGIVAISSTSRIDPSVGSLIGATVLVFNRLNGSLRTGSVMADGEHDILSGSCKTDISIRHE